MKWDFSAKHDQKARLLDHPNGRPAHRKAEKQGKKQENSPIIAK